MDMSGMTMMAGLFLGADPIMWLQSLGVGFIMFMAIVSPLGREEFYLLIVPLAYWAVDASLGVRLGVILLLASGVNVILMWAFHMPRPYTGTMDAFRPWRRSSPLACPLIMPKPRPPSSA